MKKAILYITGIMLLAIACRKQVTHAPPLSQWTFDSATYKGFAKSHPLGSEFAATESSFDYGPTTGNFAAIIFYYGYMPTKSGIYKVKKFAGDTTQCSIVVAVVQGATTVNYTSDDSNSEVAITVSANGKLSASFSNITLSYFNSPGTKIASGSLQEQ